MPFAKDAYAEQLDRPRWGLVEVAQMVNYKGTIWATWDRTTPPFLDYFSMIVDQAQYRSLLRHPWLPYLFPHLAGRHRGERIEEFRKAWRVATRKAGLPGLLVHDLRRSAVRRMEQAGVPRSVAMKLTGHRTESVYRRYAITSDADLRDAASRLGTLTGTLNLAAGNGVVQLRDNLAQSR